MIFLVLWMARLVEISVWWFIQRRDTPLAQQSAIGVVSYVFITGLYSALTTAKLALFTNKFGIAILVPAL